MAHPPPPAPPPAVALHLDSAGVPDLVRALIQVTGRGSFVMSPEVTGSEKRLTVNLDGSASAVWDGGVAALRLAGFGASCSRGLCRFYTLPPVEAPPKPPEPVSVVRYVPAFRDVPFLAGQLAGLFPSWHFAGAGNGQGGGSSAAVSAMPVSASSGSGTAGGPAQGHAAMEESIPGILVGLGPSRERERVERALEAVDRRVPSLVVRVGVYEVDVSSGGQSGVQVVGSLLAGVAGAVSGAGTGVGQGGGGRALVLASGVFNAVLRVLDNSSVAHQVTAPTLRTMSGVGASFAVGDSVPTLGSVSYQGSSSVAVQSIVYQQSGTIFSVLPTLVGGTVQVGLYQSVSSFVPTQNGVSSSPTLQNRALSSDVVLRPGQVVVLGGLMQNSESSGGLDLFGLRIGGSGSKARMDLVLVMTVDRADARGGSFRRLPSVPGGARAPCAAPAAGPREAGGVCNTPQSVSN